jgi:predicted kinase
MLFAFVVVGAAGSGKSTVAVRIAERLGAVYLDKDSLAGPLVDAAMLAQGHSLEERESSRFYRERIMPAEYAALLAVACDNLRLGLSVVIDAPFAAFLDQPGYLRRAVRLANWPDVQVTVVQVFASEAETRRRLEERGLARDRAKLSNWDEFWSRWGQVTMTWEGVDAIKVDSASPADLDALVSRIRCDDAPPPPRGVSA